MNGEVDPTSLLNGRSIRSYSMNKRLHLYYSGSVQGVGFRFTAERIASSLGITGWVKNLKDGRVEVVCEGAGKSIEEFLGKIETIFGDHIVEMVKKAEDPSGEHAAFDIRF